MIVMARVPDDQAHCRRLITAFYVHNARSVFRDRLLSQSAPFERKGLRRPHLVIREMSKRWGSYTAKGRIVLNVDLIRAAPDLIDYVISHELAHGLHPVRLASPTRDGAAWTSRTSASPPRHAKCVKPTKFDTSITCSTRLTRIPLAAVACALDTWRTITKAHASGKNRCATPERVANAGLPVIGAHHVTAIRS